MPYPHDEESPRDAEEYAPERRPKMPVHGTPRLQYEVQRATIGACKVELSFLPDKDDRLSGWRWAVEHPKAKVIGDSKTHDTAEELAIRAAEWLNRGMP
jgi:hypothetical protein